MLIYKYWTHMTFVVGVNLKHQYKQIENHYKIDNPEQVTSKCNTHHHPRNTLCSH